MSDFICINDRNQLPKYIPGYDTPEKAEAASLAMSANQFAYVEGNADFGGPGSFIKSITLVPKDSTPFFTLVIGGQTMILWDSASLYAEVPPPVTLQLGVTNESGNAGFTGLGGYAIVTGYFTPTV